MEIVYDVLVMNDADGAVSFGRQTITGHKIPETINGESGHHVCYVRTLTELIARHLVRVNHKYSFTEDEIEKMALAASLHDIGKSRVPQAILAKNSTLTPLEYDIVKKHTLFGDQLLKEYGAELDEDVRFYAEQVARYHHERYDGTGYPDGLVGDEIPIIAQIVSIADAYEALTSDRSYKKALSRDVALEMIANGMCGVFNTDLVDCLIYVADHKFLTEIRNSLVESRTIYIDPYSLPPRKVLLMGNMRYVTQEFIDATFPGAHITVIGKCNLKNSMQNKVYDVDRVNYKAILDTYDFEFIIYFANELTYDTIDPSDIEELRQIMKASKYVSQEAKFLYLSSLDAAFEDRNDRGIVSAAKENLCTFWAKENHVNLKIVRIPYLYNGAAKGDYLHDLFEQMRSGKRVRIRESESSKLYFLSLSDLSDLLIRIADTWAAGEGILNINDDFNLTFGDLCEGLEALRKGTQFDFTGKNPPKRLETKNTAVKKEYGWFSKISILANLADQYLAYLASVKPEQSFWERLKQRLAKYSKLIKLAELFVLFLLSEFLVYITGSALFFSVVDFRMAYIVIMGTLHGLPYGLGAAALSSLAWFAAKIMSGTSWMTIFYEPTNWLAFIFFFLVGAICGYVKLEKDDKIKFTEEANALLEDKLAFTRRIYEDTFNEKRDLKKQIIGSKDSFGKIFDITRQLNTVDSRELYLKIVNSFEGILENKTLSVFSINEGSAFARLEVASRDIMGNVSRSISLETYAPVMKVLQRGEVWRNSELLPNMPMFACGIYQNDKLLMMIFLWNADMQQRSLYYVNLFRILCDLAQMSFIRAHSYSQALHDKQYIPGTRVQNAEAYQTNLRSFQDLEKRKVFQFLQFEIMPEGKSVEEMDRILSPCVRTNDIIGIMADGTIRILFAQAGKDDLKFILPRFEKIGIHVNVLD